MSVSSTEHLYGLDNLLPDRPAGRNIIGHAVDTIEKLRADLAAARGLLAEANQWLRDLDVACDLQDSIDAALKAAP